MRVLVTGATGFLGGALARRLHHQGWYVTATGRNQNRGHALEALGIRFLRADLADAEACQLACARQDIVFHCGALSSPWGRWHHFYTSNVLGTQNVVNACLANNVQRLIYVSTPSLYFNLKSCLDVRENHPLPSPINEYTRSKRWAEDIVDRALDDGLSVITLRPRGIVGPGDTSIFPRLLNALQRGRLPIIGDGKTICDLTYVDNVVDALLLAASAPPKLIGHKYNITNGQPISLWGLIKQVAQRLGYQPPQRQIPFMAALAYASASELICKNLLRNREPLLTRYAVSVLALSQTLDITSARQDLGYEPRITIDEGFERFCAWWEQTHGNC